MTQPTKTEWFFSYHKSCCEHRRPGHYSHSFGGSKRPRIPYKQHDQREY